MKKIWFVVLMVLLSVSVIGCGGGSGSPGSSGDSSGTYTPYTGNAVTVSGAVAPSAGQLQIVNGQLCDQSGNAVQLSGISTMGLQWFPYTAATVDNLVDSWHVKVIRLAMYVNEGGYLIDPSVKTKLETLLQEAIKKGIYAIIDWHTLNNNGGYDTTNPNNVKGYAETFFDEMATKYGDYPNVIYEICNEPNGTTTWANIKQYANAVIPIIRAKAPHNIIIVGTPTWSQRVDQAADDPLAYSNIMYTLHFYAGTHGQSLRDTASAALAKHIAIFVTEWGTSDASGNGGPYINPQSQDWVTWMANNHISWTNWSLCNKNETSAALKTTANVSGPWSDSDLSQSGAYVKSLM